VVVVIVAGALAGGCVDLRYPPGASRDGGLLVPQTPVGKACLKNGECTSGFCADGICCKTQCEGACMTCKKAGSEGFCMPADADSNERGGCKDQGCAEVPSCDGAGRCRKKNQGETCMEATCAGWTLTLPGRCDDKGACIAGPVQSCRPFICGQDLKCRTSCSPTENDCANGSKCENGLCGKKALGTSCTDPSGWECDSGVCANGVCCDTVCEGPCRSCAIEGSAGACTAVPAGKPATEATGCMNKDGAICGLDGTCDGAGACRLSVAGKMCSQSSCANAALRPTGTCDGKGTCQMPATVTCGGYTCLSTSQCRTTCAVDAECASPAVCGNGACGGLAAQYFRQINLTDLAFMRTDPNVAFDWAGKSPSDLLNVDNFSVRWRGKITARFTEAYTFYVGSDDGERLWVNGGTPIIDQWKRHASVPEDVATRTVSLTAGQPVDIVLEYFENGGDSNVRLSWYSKSEPKAVVPTSALSPQ
jgi:hypothetical protein